MPITGGPYLTAAFLCEKSLLENDGVNSFIRVVDRWTVSGPSERMPPTSIQATLVIMFKSGIHRGPGTLTVQPVSPSDQNMLPFSVSVNFEGDEDRGIAIVAPMAFPVNEPGIYWFNVSLDGQSFTEIPLRVIYHRVAPMQMPSIPPSTPGQPPQR
jgi:hypothetical protein